MVVDEGRAELGGLEVLIGKEPAQEVDVGRDTADLELGQRPRRPLDGRLEIAAAAGQLGQERVEVRVDRRTRVGRAAIEPDSGSAGRTVGRDLTRVGPEAVGRVLGRDPALQRRTPQHDLVLRQPQLGQGRAGGDPHLRLDEVDIGDLLGHGVLDLDAGVHLDEDPIALVVEQELDRPGTRVVDRLGELDRIGAHPVTDVGIEAGRRGQLDDLLVPALDRAVPVIEMYDVAGVVGEDLDLDVAGVDDSLFDEARRITEGTLGLTHRRIDRLAQLVGIVDPAHTASTATGDGLDEQRVVELIGRRHQLIGIARRRNAPQHRDTGSLGRRDGRRLVAGELEDRLVRTDERDPGIGTCLGQIGIFAQESVARIDRIGAGLLRSGHDDPGIQIGAYGVAELADLIGLIGPHPVLRAPVLIREDRNGSRPQLMGGAEGADRDFAAIGDKDFLEHGACPRSE